MRANFNVTGSTRKQLAGIIGKTLSEKPVYRFMPTCAYDIAGITVSKTGEMSWDERTDAETIEKIKKKANSCGKENLRKLQKEQADGQKRLEDIDRIINQLYEDKVAGELSADRFKRMLGTYEEEQSKIRTRLEELHEIISAEREKTDGAEHFIRLVKQFSQITELTDEIVATFIEKVEVGVPEKVDGIMHQDVTVFYNFIGTVEY